MFIGHLLLTKRKRSEQVGWVFLTGIAFCLGGAMWSLSFPLNKQLWTSSFALLSGGLAAVFLSAFLLLAACRI
jgi:predicted acyltransferase